VDTSAFNSLYSLQRISLARNNIKSLPNQVFANLNFLLELGESTIDCLPSLNMSGYIVTYLTLLRTFLSSKDLLSDSNIQSFKYFLYKDLPSND